MAAQPVAWPSSNSTGKWLYICGPGVTNVPGIEGVNIEKEKIFCCEGWADGLMAF